MGGESCGRLLDHSPRGRRRQNRNHGHSRNGKQAAIAAAFDERIAAVVASSGKTGEGNPWRYTSDLFANETMELIIEVNPHWFSPRLRFFVGRENKLPVDQNSLFALIAPRAAMLASAYTESANSVLGFEQNVRSVQKVYDFLGAPQNLALSLRQGLHATSAGDADGADDDRAFLFYPRNLRHPRAKWREDFRAGSVSPCRTSLTLSLSC